MEFQFDNDIILVFSRNGWGKTTLVKNIIKPIPKKDVFILDTQNEFNEYPNRLFPLRHNKDVLDRFILKCRKHKHKTVVLDDFDVYSVQYSKELMDLILSNRHNYLGIVMTGKRVLGLPKVVIQNSKYLIFSSGIPVEDKEYIDKSLNTPIEWDKMAQLQKYNFAVYNTYTDELTFIKSDLN